MVSFAEEAAFLDMVCRPILVWRGMIIAMIGGGMGSVLVAFDLVSHAGQPTWASFTVGMLVFLFTCWGSLLAAVRLVPRVSRALSTELLVWVSMWNTAAVGLIIMFLGPQRTPHVFPEVAGILPEENTLQQNEKLATVSLLITCGLVVQLPMRPFCFLAVILSAGTLAGEIFVPTFATVAGELRDMAVAHRRTPRGCCARRERQQSGTLPL